MPRLPVARGRLDTAAELPAFAEAGSGRACRTTLRPSTTVGTEEITDFADRMRTALLVIDSQPRMRDSRNEIRWNHRYFRLAQGTLTSGCRRRH